LRGNIAALGEALSTVWWVEQMAHAASDRKTSVSLAFTNLAISVHKDCMNMLQYSILLRELDTGRLMLYAICIA
jgi:hypothetical protein